MFSKMWDKYWSPSGPVKFGTGLVLLGLGFAALSYGERAFQQEPKLLR